MTQAGEPLKADPNELQLVANRIDGHASQFQTVREAAQARAESVNLGSGSAAAALPTTLAAWEADGVRFDGHFNTHAHGHREAAAAYSHTDAAGAKEIDDAGAEF